MGSMELKLISLETARHLSIFFGTRASCSTSGTDRSSLPCQRIFPVSASRRFIQLTRKPFRMSSDREGMVAGQRIRFSRLGDVEQSSCPGGECQPGLKRREGRMASRY